MIYIFFTFLMQIFIGTFKFVTIEKNIYSITFYMHYLARICMNLKPNV